MDGLALFEWTAGRRVTASSERITQDAAYRSFAIIPSLWDGGRSRKCQRRVLRKKMSEHADWARELSCAPNFTFRAAHLHLQERPPFSENCLVRLIPPYNSMQRCEK